MVSVKNIKTWKLTEGECQIIAKAQLVLNFSDIWSTVLQYSPSSMATPGKGQTSYTIRFYYSIPPLVWLLLAKVKPLIRSDFKVTEAVKKVHQSHWVWDSTESLSISLGHFFKTSLIREGLLY